MTATVESRGPQSRRAVASRVGLALLAFTGPIVLSLAQRGFVYDDPFILLRYAQHLADGTGWQFNPDARTQNAVTSPLYVLIIAAGAAVGLSAVVWSGIVYAAAWGFGGLVLARVLMRDGHQAGAWVACGLYSVCPLVANVRGMETSLYLLLILCAVWAVQQQRWLVLGCVLGLLAVTRADAVLVAAVFFAWMLWRDRRGVLPAAVPFVLIWAAWTAILWVLTGDAFPSTLAAKTAQRDSNMMGTQWSFLLEFNSLGTMGASDPAPQTVILLGWLGMVVLAAAIYGTVIACRRQQTTIPLLMLIAVVVMVEYGLVLRMMASYLWHYAPWTLWATAAAGVGIGELSGRRRRALATLALCAALAGAGIAFRADPLPDRAHYREAAEWIDHDSPEPHPTIAVSEIGTIGYYGRADIVDYMGMLDPRTIDSVRRSDFTWWLQQHPDYFVTGVNAPWDAQTVELPEFQRNYLPAAQFGSLVVYRRSAN